MGKRQKCHVLYYTMQGHGARASTTRRSNMAAGYTPQRGSQYAPCEPICQHTDCKATRVMVESTCRFCSKQIGYGTRFYHDGGFVHANCLEDSLEVKACGNNSYQQCETFRGGCDGDTPYTTKNRTWKSLPGSEKTLSTRREVMYSSANRGLIKAATASRPDFVLHVVRSAHNNRAREKCVEK